MEKKVDANVGNDDAIKVYKEKPYLNSNREPFGLTLNGRSKEYVTAHGNVKDLLKKGKVVATSAGKMKFLDVSVYKAMVNATVEVSTKDGKKGNVELKVHNPSLNKKKGATIEMRKMADFEYIYVEKLRNVITYLLDSFISGEGAELFTKDLKSKIFGITSKPQLFTCDVCDWQTKFGAALKGHKKRIHENTKKRPIGMLKCENCESEFECSDKLSEHMQTQHVPLLNKPLSPCSSPPRKKLDKHLEETEVEMLDMDNMEIRIEKELNVNFLLEKRIKELEVLVANLLEEKKKDEEFKKTLIRDIEVLRTQPQGIKASKCLVGVKGDHLPRLKGYMLRYKALANGACLENCTAVHVYEDDNEGVKVKRRVNHHIADNWDNYYKDKIALPYRERVGVGEHEKEIVKNTREEMLEFLRSEEALTVYSNSQELLAIANLFNIKINIFTYEGEDGRWTEVCPDPEMAFSAEVQGKWAPDMALYHSFDTHYDLLVKEDSRLAQMGLLGGAGGDGGDGGDRGIGGSTDQTQNWNTVKPRRQASFQNVSEEEKLLTEDEPKIPDNKDLDEFEDEITLLRGKTSGHRRTAPQTSAESVASDNEMFKCPHCTYELESQGLLNAHMKTHQNKYSKLACDTCALDFKQGIDLEMHNKTEHEVQQKAEEWNCNDCPFQANIAAELIKHLKLTSHQPSKNIENKKMFLHEYKQCYTCKLEFDGYWNLMNHRKTEHPSNRKCRNFPGGNCNFGINCWYVHEEELMDIDESFKCDDQAEKAKYKCYICKVECESKDEFMKHKKNVHTINVQICEKFLVGKCDRNKEQCWYKHTSTESNHLPQSQSQQNQNQVFCEAPRDPLPPDHLVKMMEAINNLCLKVEVMEKRFKELMN